MDILVCMKAVPATAQVQVDGHFRLQREGAKLQWNMADEAALEAALQLKGQDGTVTVLTMGPGKLEEPLRELLARGADRAVLLTDPKIAGAATQATAKEDAACNCITELMEALDTYIPEPERALDQPFLMPIEDIFSITGRGTVSTGRVERGTVKLNDVVEIVGLQDEARSTVVTGIEMFRKLLDSAEAGDNIGCLLRGVQKTEIERGQVLAKPGSIKPFTKFVGQVYVLTEKEGGRHKPFFSNYRPQFYFRTTDVTGVITLPAEKEMCLPGDNVDMKVELITPIAIEKGLRFAIREGGRTVGSGVVIDIDEYLSYISRGAVLQPLFCVATLRSVAGH